VKHQPADLSYQSETNTRASGPFPDWLVRHRETSEFLADAVCWFIGLYLAMVLRFDFAWSPSSWSRKWTTFTGVGLLRIAGLAVAFQLAIGVTGGLYRRRWRYGSFEEVRYLVVAVSSTVFVLAAANLTLLDRLVPMSVMFVGGLITLLLMSAVRYLWRLELERRLRPSPERAQRVIVFGAGEGGAQLITTMLRNPDSPYLPVALLDDHPVKRNLKINRVAVEGGREEMAAAAAHHDAKVLIIAIPSASSELIRDLSERAAEADLDIRILPPIHELLDGVVGVSDLRPLTEADLLGRHEIDTDIDAISEYLTGRRVLVTGAGGSIGSELCYQVMTFAPAELVMLDRDESAIHAIQLRLEGRAMLDSRNLVVCDIRDREALNAVFAEHRPEVVFHAAALKHLSLLEMHPSEAVKTNVVGTQNLLDCAVEHQVDRVVNISTDKAADPSSVLGYTKRISEMLTARAAGDHDATFLSVRFGNVLGSRGSVLTAFHAQLAAGGPVTVTHREVTRYFMTVEEAVQLVIQAGGVGRPGEALVLDMGEPVRIDDVARRLAAQAERPVEIVYTGLRPGEKLHEVLFGQGEVDCRPMHPLISHVIVPTITISDVENSIESAQNRAELVDRLRDLANRRAGAHQA
jgi:FlaA1/EpsC-like NDP-sugar epimerase